MIRPMISFSRAMIMEAEEEETAVNSDSEIEGQDYPDMEEEDFSRMFDSEETQTMYARERALALQRAVYDEMLYTTGTTRLLLDKWTTPPKEEQGKITIVSPRPVNKDSECPICCETLWNSLNVFCAYGCGLVIHGTCGTKWKQYSCQCISCRRKTEWHLIKQPDS